MSAVVLYYRHGEFTTDSEFTIRSVFSTGGSFGLCRSLTQHLNGAFLPGSLGDWQGPQSSSSVHQGVAFFVKAALTLVTF